MEREFGWERLDEGRGASERVNYQVVRGHDQNMLADQIAELDAALVGTSVSLDKLRVCRL